MARLLPRGPGRHGVAAGPDQQAAHERTALTFEKPFCAADCRPLKLHRRRRRRRQRWLRRRPQLRQLRSLCHRRLRQLRRRCWLHAALQRL
eukprot:2238131-Alexandrium_andersonii.AAC.1